MRHTHFYAYACVHACVHVCVCVCVRAFVLYMCIQFYFISHNMTAELSKKKHTNYTNKNHAKQGA